MIPPYLNSVSSESRDGRGASDHDELYVFGRLPRAAAPFPFSVHEFARLMILRGRVQDGLITEFPRIGTTNSS
jgi:hypothetical protein